ncbi:MAG: GWxTD domain-containing protein [Candidatus Glassbacteria bacterium]|nr:GWxTD domain-containing protein [Candidatus Glassbacteria bacterium]
MYRHLSKLIVVFILGLLAQVYAQQQAEPAVSAEIQGKLDQGKQLLKSGNFVSADAMMRQIISSNPQLGEAHFFLGLAILGQDVSKKGSDNAAEHFLAAARAGYHLPFGTWEDYPVKEKDYVEANWKPADDILDDKDPQKLETAVHLLENIISVDHRAHRASERLGELYVKSGQNRKALDLFQRLLEDNPEQSESIYNIGLGYLDIYNKEIAESILADLSSEGPEKMTALMKLLMARAFFVIGDNRIASVYYFQCLDDLNEIAAREIYRDIIDIITPDERSEYTQTRTIEQKKAFFRKFWKSRDPLPTTEYNERLVEHYRRLNYAKQNYHIKQTKGYDDRGKIYIKHGEPDQTARLVGNFGLRDNETWLYRRKPDDYIFHFVQKTNAYFVVPRLVEAVIGSEYRTAYDNRPNPDNREETILMATPDLNQNFRDLLYNRAEINPLYFRMANERPDFDDTEYLRQEMTTNFEMDESRILEPGLTLGMSTETYHPDMGTEPLDYYYYTADFMAMNANSNVNIFYGLPIAELEFKRDILGVRVNYENTFAVFDQDWNEVKRVYNQRSYQLKQEPDQNNKGLLMVDKQTLNLPPGNYHYSVSVHDLGSDHLGIYKGDMEVTQYEPGVFNVSQILLASNITQLQENQRPGKFSRGNLNVMPLPSRTFRQDQSVFVYYEIYFLESDSENKKRYNVDFTIEAERLDRNLLSKIAGSFGRMVNRSQEKGKITLTFEKEGDPEKLAQVEWISIDISDSPAGDYKLNIVVTDMASGRKVTRNNVFSIVKAE